MFIGHCSLENAFIRMLLQHCIVRELCSRTMLLLVLTTTTTTECSRLRYIRKKKRQGEVNGLNIV